MNEKRAIRGLIKDCLKAYGLPHRCTRLRVEDNPILDGRPVWAWCQTTGLNTFMMTVRAGLSPGQLRKLVAHEVAHVMITELIIAVQGKADRTTTLWEEKLADLIANLYTATR